ncbi:MAG: hypothetical protein GY797_41180 [Deltaproteobacteria bacterium]|nr:hypothetical protein [Deltaproteobacteria bacterium]
MEKKSDNGIVLGNFSRDMKLLCYDGKEEHWRKWSAKFLARAEIMGYRTYLESKEVIPEDEIRNYKEINTYAYGDMF